MDVLLLTALNGLGPMVLVSAVIQYTVCKLKNEATTVFNRCHFHVILTKPTNVRPIGPPNVSQHIMRASNAIPCNAVTLIQLQPPQAAILMVLQPETLAQLSIPLKIRNLSPYDDVIFILRDHSPYDDVIWPLK